MSNINYQFKVIKVYAAVPGRKLVIKLATENLRWGYTKIRDALCTGLGIKIGRTTVANILAEAVERWLACMRGE